MISWPSDGVDVSDRFLVAIRGPFEKGVPFVIV